MNLSTILSSACVVVGGGATTAVSCQNFKATAIPGKRGWQGARKKPSACLIEAEAAQKVCVIVFL
jgi:hypothetical protein